MAPNPINFEFLRSGPEYLFRYCQLLESSVTKDPGRGVVYARHILKISLQWLGQNVTDFQHVSSPGRILFEAKFCQLISPGLREELNLINPMAKQVISRGQPISQSMAEHVAKVICALLRCLYNNFGSITSLHLPIPSLEDIHQPFSAHQLQQLAARLDNENYSSAGPQVHTGKTVPQSRWILDKHIISPDFLILAMLYKSGWTLANVPSSGSVSSVTPKFRLSDTFVDYLLWGDNGKPLALVETTYSAANIKTGKTRARVLADSLYDTFGQRPLIFYSDGSTVWLWDDTYYAARKVHGIPAKDELAWRLNQRDAREELVLYKPQPSLAQRYYQLAATQHVLEAYGNARQRKALVTMPTGTGKTLLGIAIAEILIRANWARRILFLADRISLVTQAKRVFSSRLGSISMSNLLDPESDDQARIVFSTHQTMLNAIDDTDPDKETRFSVGHFDLIVIDEAHRSVYQKFGRIFDYFDALLLGLTATPRGEVDRNTYRLFDLDNNVPTYAYDLNDAARDKYVVPPIAYSVPVKFSRFGIAYDELSEEEQAEYELQESFYDGDTGRLSKEIDSSALNRWLFNADTVDQVLNHLMRSGIKVASGDLLGKTIIFAKNRQHAEFIVERFVIQFPYLPDSFCQRVDYSVTNAQEIIDWFSERHRYPQIVVSVDMLDTGIDVPDLVNLVFFKIVRSRVKFWQMVGRGTRLSKNLFGPGQDKESFLIFDYCENLEFFNAKPKGSPSRLYPSLKTKIFTKRLLLYRHIRQLASRTSGPPLSPEIFNLGESLADDLHQWVSGLNPNSSIVSEHRNLVLQFSALPAWENLSDDDQQRLLAYVAPLPTAEHEDVYARRLDLLILNLQSQIVCGLDTQPAHRNALAHVASQLTTKLSIPAVKKVKPHLDEILKEPFWTNPTLSALEQVRLALRGLVRFVETQNKDSVFTRFTDLVLVEQAERFDLTTADPTLEAYRAQVKNYIEAHIDHATIWRLRNNKPVSPQDLESLENILFDVEGSINRHTFVQAYGTDTPLGVFVRKITGLSRRAANAQFAEFISSHNFNSHQISFIDEVINHIVENGIMDPAVLFETPFNRYHDQGVVGVLGTNAKNLITLVENLNANAMVTNISPAPH